MASILRSAKFVRYVAGFARNIVINPPREFDGSLVQNTQCFCGLQRSLATQASERQRGSNDQSLERSLRRLDQDVRRSGRISRRDIEDILDEIRQTRSATSSQSLLVIRCCGNLVPEELPEIRTKLVQEIWNTLNKLNVPMDISHYNALLRVYLENNHPFSPTEFLAELETKGIEPNRVTYQRLISQYCQQGDIEGATRILEFMREKQLPVNENVFNALIMGHSYMNDMESAKGILSVMTQAGLEPSADTFTTLLCGYATHGHFEELEKTLDEALEKDIHLLDKDYLEIVHALSKNNHENQGAQIKKILSMVKNSVGYNQDAINMILRLINTGKESIALEVLRTIPPIEKDGEILPSGNFFLKQMIKANRPVEKVLEICDILENEKLNPKAHLVAAEISLQLGNEKIAYKMIEILKEKGLPVRQHYFWPLLVSNSKSSKKMYGVLEKMSEFELTPNSETIRDFVVPYLKGQTDHILNDLKMVGVPVTVVTPHLINKLLSESKIKEAARLISRVNMYYSASIIRKALNQALNQTKDFEAYVDIVRQIHDNFKRREMIQITFDQEDSQLKEPTDVVGYLLYDFCTNLSQKILLENVEKVLEAFVAEGLSLSNSYAEKIQDKLGEKMTERISNLLGKMTSGDLVPVEKEKAEPHYVPSTSMNALQLERLISNLEKKNENVNGLKRQLLNLYIRSKDVEKTEKLLEELKNSTGGEGSFSFTPGIYAQLIDLYASHQQHDKVIENYKKLMENDSACDDLKLIRVADAYVRLDNIDEALAILKSDKRRTNPDSRTYNSSNLSWRILNFLAEKGKVSEANEIFNTLVNNNFVEVNNVILGPLIKVHLVNDDIKSALERFESIVNKYKTTPFKNELACRLIQNEDATNLQRLTDLSTVVHGEVNSLYDLVFAFVECGRIRQARRILETPGLQNRPQRLSTVCERYQEEGMLDNLEGLREATKDLSYIDRSEIFYQLLLSYVKNKDVDKALALWTEMQEEDLQPTDKFLTKLAKFLRDNGRKVPFVEPQTPIQKPRTPAPVQTKVTKPIPPVNQNPNLINFRQALKNDDPLLALSLEPNIATQLSISDESNLIESLLKHNELPQANKLLINLLGRNIHPVPRIFRFHLNKIANSGDVETMEIIGNKLNSEVKKLVSFDNRMCHCFIVAGKGEEYLERLIKEIEMAKNEHVPILAEKFPRGGAVGILEKCPELTAKYESLAEKYATRGVIAPMNVLWAHHFIQGDSPSADRIWQTYLKDAPRIMFQRIVQLARETNNEDLINRLILHLRNTKVTEGALANAYSCLLDVLVQLDRSNDVITTFDKIQNESCAQFLNRTALLRVKDAYEKQNKVFDHPIPTKKSQQNSSSEDSV